VDDAPTPTQTIENAWRAAQQDLDYPGSLAEISSGSPIIWPVEYALKISATHGHGVVSCFQLSLDGTDRTVADMMLDFYVRLRAGLYRLPYPPDPVIPEGWPTTLDASFLGAGGSSALAVAIRVLGEIDQAIGMQSGMALRLDREDGKPVPVDPKMPIDAEPYVRWYASARENITRIVMRSEGSLAALEPAISRLLPSLEDEFRRWTEKSAGEELPDAADPPPAAVDDVLQPGGRAQPPQGNDATSASADFTSVIWFGTAYTFTKGNRAESVRALWEAWESGGHSLSQETIAEKIGSNARSFNLKKTFRRKKADGGYQRHPAWGTMIQPAEKGCFRLVEPDSEKN